MPRFPSLAVHAAVLSTFLLPAARAGLPSVPPAPVARDVAAEAEGRQLLRACLDAHGGAAAYARLRDVNVRLEGKWAFLAPKLQPKLADVRHRGGSEERYFRKSGSWIVGQRHTGPDGLKQVWRSDNSGIVLYSNRHDRNAGSEQPVQRIETDRERQAAAALVVNAYTMFLFGPEFFHQSSAPVTKLPDSAEVDGHSCHKVLAILRPGLGDAEQDQVILFVDRQNHLLRRVQFTLNGLESTRGADVHVDLMEHRQLAGVVFPTRFYERIDHPVSLPAHRWRMTGFDVNRGYNVGDAIGWVFRGKAAAPARPLPR